MKSNVTNITRSERAMRHLHQLVPGGSHTYAKGDDQFPAHMLPVISRGEGCFVWDLDGKKYIEYGLGLRSITLGHGYAPILDAAYRQMKQGQNFTRPSIVELQAAEEFLDLVPGAEMVKFAKNGSDATTAALKLARAYTGRELVAICSDHPFFSIDDWFIGSTVIDRGIPAVIKKQTLTFRYNDLESIATLFAQYPDQIACIFMEPEKNDPPKDDFLHRALELCHSNGALLVLDEMITGFRWHAGGAQTLYDIVPDLSTFGKAMGNGFAISALAGRKEIMQLGGLDHKDERVFLLSTTHGAETGALAAFMAVAKAYKERKIPDVLYDQGLKLKTKLDHVIRQLGLEKYLAILGHPSCLVFATSDNHGPGSQPFRTLVLQEIMKRGIIAPNLVISAAHTDEIIDETVDVFTSAFQIYSRALAEGIELYLEGRPVQPVYRKYNHGS